MNKINKLVSQINISLLNDEEKDTLIHIQLKQKKLTLEKKKLALAFLKSILQVQQDNSNTIKYKNNRFNYSFEQFLPKKLQLSKENIHYLKKEQFKISKKFINNGLIDKLTYQKLYRCCNRIHISNYAKDDSFLYNLSEYEKVDSFRNCKQTLLCPICNIIDKFQRYEKLYSILSLINPLQKNQYLTISNKVCCLNIIVNSSEILSINHISSSIKKSFFNLRRNTLKNKIDGFYWDINFYDSKYDQNVFKLAFNALLVSNYINSNHIKKVIYKYLNNIPNITINIEEFKLSEKFKIIDFILPSENDKIHYHINFIRLQKQIKNQKKVSFGEVFLEALKILEENNYDIKDALFSQKIDCNYIEDKPLFLMSQKIQAFKNRNGYVDVG